MKQNKKGIVQFIPLVIVVILMFLLIGFGTDFLSVITDDMQFYYEKDVGYTNTNWDIIRDPYRFDNGQWFYTDAYLSTKEFISEDLKFKYKIEYSGTRFGVPTGSQIMFGDFDIPLNVQCETFAGNDQPFECDAEGIIEIKRYDDLDLTKFVVIDNKGDEHLGTNDDPVKLKVRPGSGFNLDYVKFSPYFSCKFDREHDVIIRDTFGETSVFGFSTLTYTPLRMCPEDLGVIILDDELGLTKERGSITKAIAEGDLITVPIGQTYAVRYITKYVDDMQERCDPLTEEYDTNLQSCVPIGVKQEVPTQTLLYCENDFDCIIPPGCLDAVAVCIENQCDYSSAQCTPDQIINYIEVLTTIEVDNPQIIIIDDGIEKVGFEAPKTVASHDFLASVPNALKHLSQCQVPNGEYLPTSELGCYKVGVVWGNYEFTIMNGETKELDDHVTVKYLLGGRGVFNGPKTTKKKEGDNCVSEERQFNYDFARTKDCYDKPDYQNVFQVTFTNPIEIDNIKYNERAEINSDPRLEIIIKNNLQNDLFDAGFRLKIDKGLINLFEPTTEIEQTLFGEDTLRYMVDLPDDVIGVNTVQVTPYFNMIDNNDYVSQQVSFGYYIMDIPVTEKFNCNKLGCTVGDCLPDGSCVVVEKEIIEKKVFVVKQTLFQQILNWFKNLLSIS